MRQTPWLSLLRMACISLLGAFAGVAQEQEPAPAPMSVPAPDLDVWTQATLYRDEWGVPHVYADNFRALAFVFGYAQADDHLEPMLMAYRMAAGRAAEVLGESMVPSDEFALKMRHAELAQRALAEASPLTIDLCEGFAAGVNAWIIDHPDRTPEWADGVRPCDPLALLHAYFMSMAPFDLPDIYHWPAPSFSGNAWALAPSQTQDGKPILVINPHEPYNSPFRWYEAHLVVGGMGLNISGATLFGLPMILQGHNGNLGWALTPNHPDSADMFVTNPRRTNSRNAKNPAAPELDPDFLNYIETAANTRTYFVRTEAGVVQRGIPCISTPLGPIVSRIMGGFCSFAFAGYRDFGALDQCTAMARAQTIEDFQAALSMQQLPFFHVVYADRDGNILYLYNAKICDKRAIMPGDENVPVAPRIVNWAIPQSGDNPDFTWGAPVALSDCPAIINPESGYVQACGNPPWTATAQGYLSPDDWPVWFALDRDTHRARRVRQLLEMGPQSFRDTQSMLYDILAPYAIDAIPRLLEAAASRPDYVSSAHPDLPAALDLLRRWNGVADVNAEGMTFFHVWWSALYAQDPRAFRTDDDLYNAMLFNTPEVQTLALNAAATACRVLRNEYDAINVPWGKVHVIRRGNRAEPIFGAAAGEPVFVASGTQYDNGVWPVDYGYGFAMAVEFGDRPNAVSMVPFGASEDSASPHYGDQLDLMLERRFKITRFDDADVQRNAQSTRGRVICLRPKGMEATFLIRAALPIEARLYTALEPPEPLPDGLATFTVYAGPEYVPRDAPVGIHIEVVIPETVCTETDLQKLCVYAFAPGQGWSPLPTTLGPPGSRCLIADAPESRVFAVLGPVDCRLTTTTPQIDPRPAAPPSRPKRAPLAKMEPKKITPPPPPPETAAQSTPGVPGATDASGKPKSYSSVQEVPWQVAPGLPNQYELEIEGDNPFMPMPGMTPPPAQPPANPEQPQAQPQAPRPRRNAPGAEPEPPRGIKRNFGGRSKS